MLLNTPPDVPAGIKKMSRRIKEPFPKIKNGPV
jgi:hypothetical protein